MNLASKEIEERVRTLSDSILSGEGMELADLEYRRERNGWVLRIYVDKEGGVNLDDCSRVSHEIGRRLDVEDIIEHPYTLEVSSPGLNRPLRNEKDFFKYRGRVIRVKTFDPIEQRRQFKGRLRGVVDNKIEMEIDKGEIHIPLSNIAKANLEIEL